MIWGVKSELSYIPSQDDTLIGDISLGVWQLGKGRGLVRVFVKWSLDKIYQSESWLRYTSFWSETLNLPIDKWHQCCHNRLLTFVWGVPWVHEEDYEAKESQEHRKQEFDVQLQ